MGCGVQKRIVLGGNKERFVRIKGFLYVKRQLLRTVKSCSNKRCFGCENERLLRAKRKALCEINAFGLQKSWRFLLMQSNPIKKSIFQHTKISISHYTKANEQSHISSATTYCELAVK